MFSGIVEAVALIKDVRRDGTNIHFTLSAPFSAELKPDQSIAHDGACLTVVECSQNEYVVTAIDETLRRTNMASWKTGTAVNVERCLRVGDRLDGHMVQGHVDTTARCTGREDLQGSWKFSFEYADNPDHITVPKGSICINGVSLTVVESEATAFSVHIIPYTMEHTNFASLQTGNVVNLEFDIVGKYIARILATRYQEKSI